MQMLQIKVLTVSRLIMKSSAHLTCTVSAACIETSELGMHDVC
jgi:hypothetical protein